MVSLESVTSCEPCNLAWVPKMVLANHPWQRVLDNAQNILVKISMQGLYSPLSCFRPEVARIECQLPVSRSQPTPPRPQSSAKKICKQLTPADIMLGAELALPLGASSPAMSIASNDAAVANSKCHTILHCLNIKNVGGISVLHRWIVCIHVAHWTYAN